MSLIELFILAIALSMDAFSVAVCKGLSVSRVKFNHMLLTGLWFGGFQALMPLIGYLLGGTFERYVTPVDHWIAFVLLGAIGVNMIRESFSKEEDEASADFGLKTMFLMAVATSIDALAVGITFATIEVNVIAAICFIGVITFILSALGVKLGSVFGGKYRSKAEFSGGAILIILGTKILIEHLFF